MGFSTCMPHGRTKVSTALAPGGVLASPRRGAHGGGEPRRGPPDARRADLRAPRASVIIAARGHVAATLGQGGTARIRGAPIFLAIASTSRKRIANHASPFARSRSRQRAERISSGPPSALGRDLLRPDHDGTRWLEVSVCHPLRSSGWQTDWSSKVSSERCTDRCALTECLVTDVVGLARDEARGHAGRESEADQVVRDRVLHDGDGPARVTRV
jgi:hypothetical protein